MSIPHNKSVSSIEAIRSSIEYDAQVYRWFLRYITHPSIFQRLSFDNDLMKKFKEYRQWDFLTNILVLAVLVAVGYILISKRFILLTTVVPALWGIFICSCQRRKCVSHISCALLMQDKEKIQFETKTLFHICEIYGKQLNIPTLVDTITGQDTIMRRAFLFGCVTTCFLYPLGFWSNWIILLGILFAIQTLVNTPIVFNRLR